MTGRRSSGEYHGLLVLDKPGGMTSRDAVNRVQQTLPRGTKIGHTGTLDPLATGVLVVCLGHATRLAEYVQEMPKTYRSTFRLGATSDTDDADGKVSPVADCKPVTKEQIESALSRFVGEIEQVPPAYSAAKVDGRRAYDLARGGAEIELKPRRVTVYGIDVLSYTWPRLEVEVRCGKGTYIRSLARDLGKALGCGGFVEVLRRTRVGPFRVETAISPDTARDALSQRLQPLSAAVSELPHVRVNATEATRLRQGQAILHAAIAGDVAIFDSGTLVGVARCDGELIRPTKVLPS